MQDYAGFKCHPLDERHCFWSGELPKKLCLSVSEFEELWEIHPPDRHQIRIAGCWIETPRWQQAYGRDYRYTGAVNHALPIPEILKPHLAWAQTGIDCRLNGLLVNWYDAGRKDYIGKHRDSIHDLVDGAPIVTLSFGGERVFRLRPRKGKGFAGFRTAHGSVFIPPSRTNPSWSHEVLKPKRGQRQNRISVTLRAF
jgi:alkylated DNA repair dioxygenase AlkB